MVPIVPSPTESARFGRRVARAVLSSDDDAAALVGDERLDEHDLVIVRFPAALVRAFDLLARAPGRHVVYADTLLYFRWDDDGRPLAAERTVVHRDGIDPGDVGRVVSRTFAGYVNHYAANPRLDASLVADGYAEWATSVASDPANELVANLVDEEIAGLAVIDASGPEWDVVLAGVAPEHRGGGAYGDLMTAVMARARAAGRSSVLISTQSHNVQVMRTWERLGWRIVSATVTAHLERGA